MKDITMRLTTVETVESTAVATASKHDALARELQELQMTSANDRQDLERRLRSSQEKSQQLLEELDEAREDLATTQRANDHKHTALQGEHVALQTTVENIQTDLNNKHNAWQTSQQKLAQKEAEVDELGSEILRLKAQTGDSETLAVIQRELSEQVSHIRKLEALNREQHEELHRLRKTNKNFELLEEEKMGLQSQLDQMNEVRRELRESELRRQVLEDERQAWNSYLETDAGTHWGEFRRPEDLARAFAREKIETAELTKRLGELEPELALKDDSIQTLEDEKAKLTAEIATLKTVAASAAPADRMRIRLEKQKTLASKEVDYLRAQFKALETEAMEMQPEQNVATYDAVKSTRIQELEGLVDEYRSEVETLSNELSASAPKAGSPATTGQKRHLEEDVADERLGELRRKNRQLQDDVAQLQKRNASLEHDVRAQTSQLASFKSSRTRILELRSNPTADAEALKLGTVRTLRQANGELLAQLQRAEPAPESVPRATITAAQHEMAELEHTVAEREKRMKRLKQIWSAKSAEFREAVMSVLGWKLDFMPNGRVRVTSMFYPADEATGENSIVFDGEKGTMKVSGGPQSAFANEIRNNIAFWVQERKQIPCFLAALTLEFYERNTVAGG